jgi:hypothetical protein
MRAIEKVSQIKREALNSEFYFQSLLEQAHAAGMLSDSQLEGIQFDCLALLAKQTEKYNRGSSSSIQVEAAQNLLTSIMFTIGVWLKTYPNPDEAVAALQKGGVSTLFQKGVERIERLIKSSKTLHSLITKNLVQTPNEFYRSTIVDGIKGFFKLYRPEFAAHETHITADYPISHRMERLMGIEFIHKYLECVYYENLFCAQFSAEDVHHLLCGYDEHYEQMLINIYELVLLAAMGCILSGRDCRQLELVPSSVQILGDLFHGKTRAAIEKILRETVIQLSAQLELSEPLQKYVGESLPQLAATIEIAARLLTLDRVFLVPQYPENNPQLIFSFGEKMADEKYSKVLEEIKQCRYLADKKALIKSEIHSLADLEDLLLDAELSEAETLSILGELSAIEIAALLKKYPETDVFDLYGLADRQVALSECLQKYLAALPAEQQEAIRRAAAALNGRAMSE